MKLFNFNSRPSETVQEAPAPAGTRWKPSDEMLEALRKIDEFLGILPELSGNISALAAEERGHLANIHAFGTALAEAFEGMDAITNSSAQVTGNSQEYKQVITRTEQQLKTALDSFDLVDQSYQRSSLELNGLFVTTAELENLAGLMAGLSVRIKQLVRNAEIRAFHAGSRGKGFGVIAENMSRLAGEMERTASLVPSLTAEVKESIRKMSSGVQESRHLVDGLKSRAGQVKDRLNSLYRSNQETVEAFDKIGLMSKEQRELENRLVGGLKNIAQSAEGLSVSQEVTALVLSTETGEMGQVDFAKNQMDEALELWARTGSRAALHEAGNNWAMLKAKLQAASERWRELQSTIDDQKSALGAEEELAGTMWHNLEALFENINRIKTGLDGMGQTLGRNRQDFEEMSGGLAESSDNLARIKNWLDVFEADREGMSARLGEIAQTGTAIKDFTEQIKLLSFYAAVEVAEMGQGGGDFGGIVGQAQSLSQQAAADSAKIGPLLKQVTEQFAQTSGTVRQTQKIMGTSLESVSQARRSLDLARESGGQMEQIAAEAGQGIGRQQSRHQDIFGRYNQYSLSYQGVAAKLQGFSGFLQKGRESLAWFERMGSLGRAEIEEAGLKDQAGGRLLADISSDPITLDPAMMTDATSNEVAAQIFEGLVQFGTGASVVPAAAWRWKISPDGLSWTFYLRRGIRFSHGREMTALDVKYSLERLLSPKVKSPNQSFVEMIKGAPEYSQGKAREVAGLQVIDQYAIKIVLQYPFMPFLSNLACTMAAIVPKELVEDGAQDFSRHPAGTGPFLLKSWEPGRVLELEPNPRYHERRISLSGIHYSIDLSDEQKAEALASGRLDVTDINSQQRRALAADRSLKVVSLPQLNVQYLCINVSKVSPFADRRVRQALNYAVDKKALIETTELAGDAVAAKGVFPPELWAYNPELAGYDHDPARARKLLAEAGYSGGLPGEYLLDIRESRAQLQRAEIVRQNCREIGINIKINPLSWKALLERTYSCQSQLSFNGWNSDNGDPDNFLYPLFHSKNTGRSGNVAFFKSPAVDELLEEAVTIRDPGQRLLRYRKIEAMIVQEAPWVFMYHTVKSTAVRNTVHGFRPRPFGSEHYKHCWVEN